VQTNLFPKSPVTVDQLELHAICIPARTVSGDYFDFIFGRSNTGLCLALGDISGKGISAALLMASLHSAVRAFGLSTSNGNAANGHSERPSPALLLKLINRHLYSSTTPEKYATLFLAYYDGESRQLTYSNGGHLPPVVISTDGRIQELTCGGPVVGLLAGLEYEEATVELRPGDLLMAYTDGLTEPENEFGEFGEQRLVNFVQKHSRQALPSIADTTMKELQQWIGNHEQPDDMTILLARQL
jgi:phosphoserine phosphatase RsbU/P